MFLCLFLESLSQDLLISNAASANKIDHQAEVGHKIRTTLKTRLPKHYRSQTEKLYRLIVSESKKHRLDPLIVTAVISIESNFNPVAVGPVGELGLMQLRASTAEWIAGKMRIPWKGVGSLTNPEVNIKLGTAYLSFLKKQFSKQGGYLYLAAYNMGIGSVLKSLAKKVHPKIYSNKVLKNYVAIND